MARRRQRNRNKSFECAKATVDSLAHDGRGVARVNDQVVFIDGALPGEEVTFQYTRKKKDFAEGAVVDVIKASEHRVDPPCEHYGRCGGCSFQHVSTEQQILAKQQILVEQFQSIGHVEAFDIWPALTGPTEGYRHRARLGVKDVPKKGRVLVGFREKQSPFLAEIERCEVLQPSVGHRLLKLSALIGQLSIKQKIPQIEVAVSDHRVALVFRVLETPTDEDKDTLQKFSELEQLDLYLQPKGPDTITPLSKACDELTFKLPNDVTLYFGPSDFVQINVEINRKMITRVLDTLNLNEQDQVLDLFCGLGNFTLPMAKTGAQVTGVEGSAELIARARENAQRNGLDANTKFYTANLMEQVDNEPWIKQRYNKVLIDPPRLGAKEILHWLPKWDVEQLVYVSCNPSTLARDVDIIVNQLGFKLVKAGVMDMFPHTAHVESIALFER